MANDFHEERKWKKVAAGELARQAVRARQPPRRSSVAVSTAPMTAHEVLAWWRRRQGAERSQRHARSKLRDRHAADLARTPRRAADDVASAVRRAVSEREAKSAAADGGSSGVPLLQLRAADRARCDARAHHVIGRLQRCADRGPQLLVVPTRAVGAWSALLARRWGEASALTLRTAMDLWLPWRRVRQAHVCVVGAEALSTRCGRELVRRDWATVTFAWTNRRSPRRAEATVAAAVLRELAQCACGGDDALPPLTAPPPPPPRWVASPRGFAHYNDGCAVESLDVWSALAALALPRAFGALDAARRWCRSRAPAAALLLLGGAAPRASAAAALAPWRCDAVSCTLAPPQRELLRLERLTPPPPPPSPSRIESSSAAAIAERNAIRALVVLHAVCNRPELLSSARVPLAVVHAAGAAPPAVLGRVATRRPLDDFRQRARLLDVRVGHGTVVPRLWLVASRWLAQREVGDDLALRHGSAASIDLGRCRALRRLLPCARTVSRGFIDLGRCEVALHRDLVADASIWALGLPGLARCVAAPVAAAPASMLATLPVARCAALRAWRAAALWRRPELESGKWAELLRALRDARARSARCAVLAHDPLVLAAAERCLLAWRWPYRRASDGLFGGGTAHVVLLALLPPPKPPQSKKAKAKVGGAAADQRLVRLECGVAILLDGDGDSAAEAMASVARVVVGRPLPAEALHLVRLVSAKEGGGGKNAGRKKKLKTLAAAVKAARVKAAQPVGPSLLLAINASTIGELCARFASDEAGECDEADGARPSSDAEAEGVATTLLPTVVVAAAAAVVAAVGSIADHRSRFLAAHAATSSVPLRLQPSSAFPTRAQRRAAIAMARQRQRQQHSSLQTKDLFYPVAQLTDGTALDWSASYTQFLFNAKRESKGAQEFERALFGPPSARPIAALRVQMTEDQAQAKLRLHGWAPLAKRTVGRGRGATRVNNSLAPLPPATRRPAWDAAVAEEWGITAASASASASSAAAAERDVGEPPLVVSVLYRNRGAGVRKKSAHIATPVIEYPKKGKASKVKVKKRGRGVSQQMEASSLGGGGAMASGLGGAQSKRSRCSNGASLPWLQREEQPRDASETSKRALEQLRTLVRLTKRVGINAGSRGGRARARSVDLKVKGMVSPRTGRKRSSGNVHAKVVALLGEQTHASHHM